MIIMYIKFSLKSVSCCCINVKVHNSVAYLSNDSCIISTNRETSCSEHLAIKYIIAGHFIRQSNKCTLTSHHRI